MKPLSKLLIVVLVTSCGTTSSFAALTSCASGKYVHTCTKNTHVDFGDSYPTCNASKSNAPCVISTSGNVRTICAAISSDSAGACGVCGWGASATYVIKSLAQNTSLPHKYGDAYQVIMTGSTNTECGVTDNRVLVAICNAGYYASNSSSLSYITVGGSGARYVNTQNGLNYPTCDACPTYKNKSGTSVAGSSPENALAVSICSIPNGTECKDTAGTYSVSGCSGTTGTGNACN